MSFKNLPKMKSVKLFGLVLVILSVCFKRYFYFILTEFIVIFVVVTFKSDIHFFSNRAASGSTKNVIDHAVKL